MMILLILILSWRKMWQKNTKLSTSESVARKMTENPDENVVTEEEMDFDDLNIRGDYSDCDILE